MALGFAPRRVRVDPVEHRRSNGCCATSRCSAAAACPTASIRPMPRRRCTTCAKTRAPPCSSSRTTSSSTRRSKCARSLPLLRKIVVFDMEGLRDLRRRRRDEPRRAARAGPRLPATRIPRELDAARRRLPARGPGHPGLHLRHHRQAQGRDAQPSRAGLHRARLQHADRAGRARRAHVLPAAVPHRRAHGRRVLRDVHRLDPQLRREPRDRAGERARDRAHRLHRRAARVGEVLFGRDDRAQGSERRCSRRPTRWSIGVGTAIADRVLAGQPVGGAAASSSSASRAGWRWTTCAS